jgi:hypothetical protein
MPLRSNNWVSVNFMGSSIRLETTIAAVTTEAPRWRRSRRGRIQPQGQAASSSRAHYRSAATEKPVLSKSSYCCFLADRIIE